MDKGVAAGCDSSGGAIIVWRLGEEGHPTGGSTYAQRLDAEGKPLWPEGGVPVYDNPDLKYQDYP